MLSRVPTAILCSLLLATGCGSGGTSPEDGGNGNDAQSTMDAMNVPEASVNDAASGDVAMMPVGDPRMWDVRRRGPFRSGYRTWMYTYTPRGSTTPRTIPMHVWYPTFATSGRHPTFARLFTDSESVIDAPLAPAAHPRGYPVHVYSHGDRGFGGTSYFLMRYFATHGWVSIAPDHVSNTLLEPVIDPRPYPLYHWRSQDVSAALDALDRLASTDPLAGRMDTRRTLLTGHSFGSHTLWASAGATFDLSMIQPGCTAATRCTMADLDVFRMGLRDERFVAVVPMAGSLKRDWFGPEGHRSVRVPMLSISGTADPVGAEQQFASTMPVDLTWIEVRDGCHQFFALGGCENIPDALQDPILGAWVLAFGRRHVFTDDDPTVQGILSGTLSVSDRVTVHRR